MTKEEMIFYFQVAQHLSWEKFQGCMIQPDDDGDTCEDKILDVCICFPHHTMQAWSYFKAIYKDIWEYLKMIRCNCDAWHPEIVDAVLAYLKNR